jgi:cobalamin biosynthesis protein CbiG
MNRLATNGANKVVSSAKALNAERKAEQAAKKKKEEMERQMIEDKKKAEEAAKKNRNLQTKRCCQNTPRSDLP